jgi:soluble lytic murein transglycosylase
MLAPTHAPMNRYALMLALFVLAVGVPSAFLGQPAPRHGVVALDTLDVPPAVGEAARQGRFWRASRILGEYLATVPDTTPETILMASRLSAGWGDWENVGRLLEGRDWLDRLEHGAGWRLLGRSWIELGRLEEGSEALGHYLQLGQGGDRDRGVAQLRRAIALGDAGDTDAALQAFDSAAAHLPWFADWVGLMAARAAAETGDTAAVRTRLARAGDLAGDAAWRLRLQAAREAGDLSGARRAALEAARAAGSADGRAAAWAQLGELRVEAGDTAGAREAFRSAMSGAPGSVGAVTAARGMSGLDPTPEEWRTIGSIYRRHGNATRAMEALSRYLDGGVGEPAEVAQVRLELGRARFDAGRYADAERGLLALADDDVPARIGAEALYLAGRAQYRQGRGQEGQATLVRVAERFPGQEAVTRGLYLVADLKHDDLEIAAARRYYRQAADASPSLSEAGLSLMRLGGLAFLDRDYDGAAAVFEEYLRLHPEGRRSGQAAYWAARSDAAAGREAEATARLRALREEDPLSYYGVLAAERLGEPVLDVPLSPAPPRDAATDSLVEAGLRRVEVLAALEQRADLVHEVERLRRHFTRRTGGDYALAEALNDRGYTLTAISMGWDIYRGDGGWNPRLLRVIYPFPFQDLVLPESRERGLDPFLVAGLIRRESAFNPAVVSSAGAIGLMQIMPQTGRGLAQGAGLRGYEPEILKQPEVNVHLGTRYFESLMERFDGSLPLVLSAYNAGPSRARRWQAFPEARDAELFTERIPYAETRNYVRNVLLHRALYEALYPEAGRVGTTVEQGTVPDVN